MVISCRLHRLLRIIRLVRRPRYPNVQELCDLLEVRPRTIFKDLQELKEMLGVAIKFDRSKNGYYLQDDDWQLNFWGLEEETAVLLLVANRLVNELSGEQFAAPLRDMFGKEVQRCLSDFWQIDGGLDDLIDIEVAAPPLDRNVFIQLCRATAKRQKVILELGNGRDWAKSDEPPSLTVKPTRFVLNERGWLLMARNDRSEHMIKVCHIRKCTTIE